MAEEMMNLAELVSGCVDCARRASNEIRAVVDATEGGISGGELVPLVENKCASSGGWDPLTEADIRAQKLIVSLLSHQWPTLAIVGEEDECEAANASTSFAQELLSDAPLNLTLTDASAVPEELTSIAISRLCLFVDPLDGTKEFTCGNYDAVQTLIGIALDGKAIAGIMHAPFHDSGVQGRDYYGSTVYGIVGGKCVGLDEFECVSENSRGLVVTTSASRSSKALEASLEDFQAESLIRCGGAGNKFLHMLVGKADIYVFPRPYTSLWDTCAGEACLRARYPSGRVTDCVTGDSLPYVKGGCTNNTKGILATTKDHDKYLAIVMEHTKAFSASL